jgi:hypothetical protein
LAPPIGFRSEFTSRGFDGIPNRLRASETVKESGITASRHHRDSRIELSNMTLDVVGDRLPQQIERNCLRYSGFCGFMLSVKSAKP